jgi:phenylacetic acid degradation operon negative regulatory protein
MRPRNSVSNGPRGPDPVIARWVRRTLASDPPRAKSLIVTVWGDALAPHGGTVWLSGLIRLLAPFSISERLARTSVFRLARDGWLAVAPHGRRSRYRLTDAGARRFEEAYRRIYVPPDPAWDGRWELVLASGTPASAARKALRDALRWAGFGTFAPGVLARPLRGAGTAARLTADLKLAADVTVLEACEPASPGGVPLAARVHDAFDLRALAADYRRYLALFDDVAKALRARAPHALDAEQCFVVRTLLIHAFRRVQLRDPHLPPSLLPADWPGRTAFVLTRDCYRLMRRPAERHLAAVLAADGDTLAPADAAFEARFDGV